MGAADKAGECWSEEREAVWQTSWHVAHQLEQALLKVVIVLALVAHELRNGALALAQLAQAEGPQLVQLPADQKPLSLPHPPQECLLSWQARNTYAQEPGVDSNA